MASKDIKHKGRITAISHGEITVTILTKSACASCEAKGMCNSFEMKDKEVYVNYFGHETWTVGEDVNVTMKPSMGRKAVFVGYVIPLLVLILAMTVAANLTTSEAIIGASSIGAVGIYFLLLWLFRNKLNNTFTFSIEKYTEDDSACEF